MKIHKRIELRTRSGMRIFLVPLFLFSYAIVYSQNVGIGTAFPTKKLSVVGSVLVDQTNKNYGTLDSAALLFGSAGTVGITSKKIGASGLYGLNFWTGGDINLSINSVGQVGIGGDPIPGYKFYVHNGDTYLDGDLGAHTGKFGNVAIGGNIDLAYKLRVYGNGIFDDNLRVDGIAAIGGATDANYKLRVYGGNSRFGGDLHATGNAAVGGDVDNNYRLRVYGGNSRFGGDVQVTGTLNSADVNVDNTLTINGKGSVSSNGSSPLRIGFNSKYVNMFIANNDAVMVTANITDFSGGVDDVRVMISHATSDPAGSLSWSKIGMTVMGVDASTNTCVIWLHNRNGNNGMLVGTIYLTTIARD